MGITEQLLLGRLLIIVYACSNVGVRVEGAGAGFVQTRGNQLVVDGHTFNFNGFNAYWMMVVAYGGGATNQNAAGMMPAVLQQASQHGLTVGRTWAFSDGGAFPLQSAPGVYNEAMFMVVPN